jgi:phosphoglycerate dehydrogenase-like enzyme
MRLSVPCEVITDHEVGIVSRMGSVDVLITMCFTKEMADAGPRLKLIQVPGAGLDRIERAALRPGTRLANAYGHEVGIAEYIIGAMIALQRSFSRIDAKLRCGHWESQWACGAATTTMARARGQDARHSRLWPHRGSARSAGAGL